MAIKTVESNIFELSKLLGSNYNVDFYQREYVWQTRQLEDLINDLSNDFLRQYKKDHSYANVGGYDPYFMGEIVVSTQSENNAIIDGQQRITTFLLLLIYIKNTFGNLVDYCDLELESMIYDKLLKRYRLNIKERKEIMDSLFISNDPSKVGDENVSITNLLDRYNDFSSIWNEEIDDDNALLFAYYIKEKVLFSRVWTNSDEFAYVIFETMNDRGVSLTSVEMLRSYILANIETDKRDASQKKFDEAIDTLLRIKLSSKSEAKFEFFKVLLRTHFAQDFSQKDKSSDFTRIGNEFHRWVRDSASTKLNLNSSDDFVAFVDIINYFAKQYEYIFSLMGERNTKDYLYLIVNADYGFTLQPTLILSAIEYKDSVEVVEAKTKIISKYLAKQLSWRIWNHYVISQSSLEASIFELVQMLREGSIPEIEEVLMNNEFIGNTPTELNNSPTLNQQNGRKLRVLLALITEIVAKNCAASDYLLTKYDKKDPIEIEHIWANHFEDHRDEFDDEGLFASMRNNIGDLILAPKSFNASWSDNPYSIKIEKYFGQNALTQTLNPQKYSLDPQFAKFIRESNLPFAPYEHFKTKQIIERAELYKQMLEYDFKFNV